MGRSDPYVFSKYYENIGNKNLGNCCFLGYSSHNGFTSELKVETSSFYDLSLQNWNINDKDWKIKDSSFDSIVCTRVAYFCKDVSNFFKECFRILKPGGLIFVDWGLGDHWRFENYKVGWLKNDEQEWCYDKDNFLWSTVWSEAFIDHPEYKSFESLNFSLYLISLILRNTDFIKLII